MLTTFIGPRCSRTLSAAMFGLVVAASAGGAHEAMADGPAGDAVTVSGIAALEQMFWRCDHAATTRLLDFSEGADCAAAMAALKQARFADDFAAMLQWWEANKDGQHARIERERG